MSPKPKKPRRPDRSADRFNEVTFVGGHPHELVWGESGTGRGGRDRGIFAVPQGGKPSDAVAFDGHRFRTHLELTEENYLKSSDLTGNEIRKAAELCVYMDDEAGQRKLIYVKHAREIEFLMHWWLAHKHEFFESWLQLYRQADLDRLKGRKLWWNGQRAIAKSWDPRRYLTIESEDPRGFMVAYPDERDGPVLEYNGLDPWDCSLRGDD